MRTFLDTEMSTWAWGPISKSCYWHRLFSHQPDLNYDNPAVREEMWNVTTFGAELGVDGFRLDAMYALGVSYDQNGDTENALLSLNKVRGRRSEDILPVKVDPDLDPLRSDP